MKDSSLMTPEKQAKLPLSFFGYFSSLLYPKIMIYLSFLMMFIPFALCSLFLAGRSLQVV